MTVGGWVRYEANKLLDEKVAMGYVRIGCLLPNQALHITWAVTEFLAAQRN